MIGFIGALDEEIKEILELMDTYTLKKVSNINFYIGKLSNKDCILTKSNVGKVNAALTTTVLLENFDIDGVVNIGTAGGLKDTQEVLDVIISDKVAYHDMFYPSLNLSFDNELISFKSDEKYVELMKNIIDENSRAFIGNIVTGDQFIYKQNQIDYINEHFSSALCAEMEAAAIADVCNHYNKPFIVIRSLSDITLKDGNEISFDEYVSLASKKSAIWCKKFIELI